MSVLKETQIADPRHLRLLARLNQHQFWSAVGVTQSGGSRYESGRTIPKAVRELLRIVYMENVKLTDINGEGVMVAKYMKEHEPQLYRQLKKSAKAANSAD